MDRTLSELEKAFCAGLVSRRDFFRRTAFLLASTTAAFELLGRLSPRRLAWASLPITLDLSTTDLASQGYFPIYDPNAFSVDTGVERLVIVDSDAIRCAIAKQVPEIPTTALDVSVLVRIDEANLTLDGIDTGVHAVLNEGNGTVGITGHEVRVACIERAGGDRRIALALVNGGFSQGIACNSANEVTFQVKRAANGDGTIEFNGGTEGPIPHALLAAASRPDAEFQLGCFSTTAVVTARFGPIGMPVFPMTLTPSIVQLFPNASEKVHIEGSFALDSSSNGINPAAETVALRLFKPDGSRIYPVGTDKMPVAMVPVTGGWSISAAEKTRTGIQDFQILQTGDHAFFVFKLVDTRTSLPQADYNQVRIEIAIADDTGSLDLNLVERSGRWSLA